MKCDGIEFLLFLCIYISLSLTVMAILHIPQNMRLAIAFDLMIIPHLIYKYRRRSQNYESDID